MSVENSGLSCDYYVLQVEYPWKEGNPTYETCCGEIMEALDLTVFEANIFKEIWRQAAERQGKRKTGNTTIRGAEKIKYFSNRIYITENRKRSTSLANCEVTKNEGRFGE